VNVPKANQEPIKSKNNPISNSESYSLNTVLPLAVTEPEHQKERYPAPQREPQSAQTKARHVRAINPSTTRNIRVYSTYPDNSGHDFNSIPMIYFLR
jgi:hypothetical protein